MLPAPDHPISGLPTRRSGAPILCYVTDRKILTTREDETDWRLVGKIRGTIGAGVDWVQVRERDLPPQKILALVREIVRATDTAKLIVNDRLDVAVAAAREQVTWERAHEAGLLWRPVPGAEDAEPPYELQPGTGRRGPEDLWQQFDAAVADLNRAITGSSAANVAAAFGRLADAASELAEAVSREDEDAARAADRVRRRGAA